MYIEHQSKQLLLSKTSKVEAPGSESEAVNLLQWQIQLSAVSAIQDPRGLVANIHWKMSTQVHNQAHTVVIGGFTGCNSTRSLAISLQTAEPRASFGYLQREIFGKAEGRTI